MKTKCSHPDCDRTRDLPWYNALYCNLFKLWLCQEHREIWDHVELKPEPETEQDLATCWKCRRAIAFMMVDCTDCGARQGPVHQGEPTSQLNSSMSANDPRPITLEEGGHIAFYG